MLKTFRKYQAGTRILFIIYLLLVIIVTLFKKNPLNIIQQIKLQGYPEVFKYNLSRAGFIPFKSINFYITHYIPELHPLLNIFGNVIMFIPFGILLPLLSDKYNLVAKTALMGFYFSLTIELIQLFTMLGYFEVDDLMLNTLGAITGFYIYVLIKKIAKPVIPGTLNP